MGFMVLALTSLDKKIDTFRDRFKDSSPYNGAH